ncbi:SDR family oxidoreductase [Nocardioides endophyticus]|uniref:SDR family oxidoreductase n=1 Tax=Nocardioides endophyticus TaxID=1353775 RepID=A0ABP8YNU9_9ACTN
MKVALVTGASAGIGQAAAFAIARAGVGVITTYRSHGSEGEATAARITAEGGRAVALPLDLGDVAGLDGFVEQVVGALSATFGATRLDYLVNNAGIGGGLAFGEVTEEAFDRYERVLLRGPYFLTQKLLPVLADGGAIVNTGSTSALPNRVSAGYSVYAALKGAVHTVTPYWAKELAPRRIRVNAVAPGTTRTRIGDDAFARMPELIPAVAEGIALGRIGEPDDAAAIIAFLLSDAAAWVTGQVIEVSGGERL